PVPDQVQSSHGGIVCGSPPRPLSPQRLRGPSPFLHRFWAPFLRLPPPACVLQSPACVGRSCAGRVTAFLGPGLPDSMMFDLPTLLAVWLGIDLLVGLAFWAQHQRLPHAGGLAWWALAALTHACAAMALGSRPLLPAWLGLPLSNLLFTLTFALLWVGLRSYLEL